VQNSTLTRQLSARPIVYHFGPSPGDEEHNAGGTEEEDVEMAAEPIGQLGLRVFVCVAALWCRRRTLRAVAQCRKQRVTQSLERSLRSFTRGLLQRPLLLWLFYTHVVALWMIEFWRQAVNRAVEADPSNRIEQLVAASRAGRT